MQLVSVDASEEIRTFVAPNARKTRPAGGTLSTQVIVRRWREMSPASTSFPPRPPRNNIHENFARIGFQGINDPQRLRHIDPPIVVRDE
jgi:hypothetical protein